MSATREGKTDLFVLVMYLLARVLLRKKPTAASVYKCALRKNKASSWALAAQLPLFSPFDLYSKPTMPTSASADGADVVHSQQ